MEPSHIFPVFPHNGSTGSLGQNPSEVAWGCPLGPLPVIYYSVLLCLGLPGRRRAPAQMYCPLHVSLHTCGVLLVCCILIHVALVLKSMSCCSAPPECHAHISLICHSDLVAVCHTCIHTLCVFVSACAWPEFLQSFQI